MPAGVQRDALEGRDIAQGNVKFIISRAAASPKNPYPPSARMESPTEEQEGFRELELSALHV